MDFATEQTLCRLADGVWRQAAAEPGAMAGCTAGQARTVDAARDVLDALHLQEVFSLDAGEGPVW